MTGNDVIEFIQLLDDLHVHVWIDGGWAVDACLGSQTRPHADLDIVIEERDVDVVVRSLRERGFSDVTRDDTRAWNFVLGDPAGREIDFHVIVLDQHGQGIYGAAENGDLYSRNALSGTGAIGGRRVDCINPAWLVRFNTGYAVDEDDWADVSALHGRFGAPIPDDYAKFADARAGA
jgi:lincosamide nucleotidyltransferase A/C/D/E